MASLSDLVRRLSRKLEGGKAIQLTPDDLDLLVVSGAYAKLCESAVEEQRGQCLQRSARNRSMSGGLTASSLAQVETTKSSGTMPSENASEVLAQVLQMTGRGA